MGRTHGNEEMASLCQQTWQHGYFFCMQIFYFKITMDHVHDLGCDFISFPNILQECQIKLLTLFEASKISCCPTSLWSRILPYQSECCQGPLGITLFFFRFLRNPLRRVASNIHKFYYKTIECDSSSEKPTSTFLIGFNFLSVFQFYCCEKRP